MGKRKSTVKKIVPSKKKPLQTTFKCPFCSHDDCIQCTLSMKSGIGKLECRRCAVTYSTSINYLSEPIDLFTEWIDACMAENAVDAEKQAGDEVVPGTLEAASPSAIGHLHSSDDDQ